MKTFTKKHSENLTKSSANNMANNMAKSRAKTQRGFTLIELLVVVSILAALAGITSVAMDGYQQDAEEKITRVEMQRIAGAIRRFKADTGYWPKTGPFSYKDTQGSGNVGAKEPAGWDDYIDNVVDNPANFSFLFTDPVDHIAGWNIGNASANWDADPSNPIHKWDIDYAIGWHGPYIDHPAIKTIIRDTINPGKGDGCRDTSEPSNFLASSVIQALSGKANATYPDSLVLRMNGLVDRFEQIREKTPGEEYCVLTRDEKDMTQYKVADFSGSPYLYETNFTSAGNAICLEDTTPPIDSTITCKTLRSFGRDGVDNSGADASDDIVFVLEVN